MTSTDGGMGRWAGRAALWLGLRLLALVAALGLLGALACFIAYFIVTPRHFDREALENIGRVPGVTFIDDKGNVLATRGAYHGDQVKLKDLPPYLVDAFIATEDRRFYTHFGVDPWGILRALVTDIRLGYMAQGGSTITQQLARNLFLSSDRTFSRKFKEALDAIWLEHHLTKDEILTLYLNRIYFGAGTYGIDAAAEYYFDKPASQVTLSEAAVLAGLPKAPTKYAPTLDKSAPAQASPQTTCDKEGNLKPSLKLPDATQRRATLVLQNLVDAHYITQGEADTARAHPAVLAAHDELGSIQYYLDYVYARLGAILSKGQEATTGDTSSAADQGQPGEAPSALGSEDLIVYTTIDKSLQQDAEEALIQSLNCYGDLTKVSKSSPDPEGALVSITPDGNLRAMVGGRSYIDSQFNRATSAMRQPGSAFKPFVYLTALENGYTPDTIVEDSPITIQTPEGPWSPTDYESDYKGLVTLREALADSLNTAAIRISESVGPDKVVATAQRLGITSPLQPLHSIALGTQLVTPLELTSAYTPFADGGLKLPVHTIVRVETKSGKVLYQYQAPDPVRVIAPDISTEMNSLMFSVIEDGTGRNASLGERPAAGKTGTGSDWRDAWFVGYTGDLVTGVWIGNDDDSPMNHVTGGGLPAQIWKSYMSSALQGTPIAALPGAFPTLGSNAIADLRSFFSDLAASFKSAEQGGSPIVSASGEASGAQADQPVNNAPPQRRCRWLIFCRGD